MNSDQRDDRDRYESDDRRREDDDRPRRRRSRDDDDRPRSRARDDDDDDRPRRRRNYDDDYDRRPRKGGNSTLIIVLCVVGVVVVVGGAIFYFAAQRYSEAKMRIRSQNNLKQLAIGMNNYESAYGHFPAPAICDKQGKPLLSWRVAILPFVEQAHLYNQFKLDEPWDGPNNKRLLSQMPKLYAPLNNQAVADEYKTYYRVFCPKGEEGVEPTMMDLTKGISNTVMIVESGEPVLWTKPDELEYEVGKPLPALGGVLPDCKTFNIALFDGSVRAIPRDEADTIKDMIRPKSVRLRK